MIDIISADENGIQFANTDTPRAANLLSVQLGSLEYAPDVGIDLNYFLTEDILFQNESFKAYLVEVLANKGVNVTSVETVVEALSNQLIFNLSRQETSTGLIKG